MPELFYNLKNKKVKQLNIGECVYTSNKIVDIYNKYINGSLSKNVLCSYLYGYAEEFESLRASLDKLISNCDPESYGNFILNYCDQVLKNIQLEVYCKIGQEKTKAKDNITPSSKLLPINILKSFDDLKSSNDD